MCGRYSLSEPEHCIHKLTGFSRGKTIEPNFNICPGTHVPALLGMEEKKPILSLLQWGLIPFWAKENKTLPSLINARVETITEKPSFRTPFRYRRCLLPADGFFEWKKENREKIPYFISLKNKNPFFFAGIWDQWVSEQGIEKQTFAILTTKAKGHISNIHERMPVIFSGSKNKDWLNPEINSPKKVQGILETSTEISFEINRVSKYVNNPRNNGIECITSVTA
tara:strand:- start:17323 stop:17994 length:672 start_codon:yes stop_codon:yes gene_type:complete